jgi:hypothetical protein
MRPDPGRAMQEAVIARMSIEERQAVRMRLTARGRLLAWQQVDAAGPTTEPERAELLLRRLYPTMPGSALVQIIDQLAEAQARGDWGGFRRPKFQLEELAGRR